MTVDPSMSILVVDDSAATVRITCNMLRQLGLENVDEAHGVYTAFEKMRAKRYGLVISDWNMEPMAGYDFLALVRADQALAEIPFIVVTAEANTATVIAAKKAGANGYILKPFSARTLQEKIRALFR